MSLKDHAVTMALYHEWAHRTLLESLAPLDDSRYHEDVGLFFGSIHDTLNHLLLADRVWLSRFNGMTVPYKRLDETLEENRAALAAATLAQCDAIARFVTALDGVTLEGTLEYHTLAGKPMSTPYSVALMHLFNHGTHHRGQVTAAMTQLGVESPAIDLVYFLPHRAATEARLLAPR